MQHVAQSEERAGVRLGWQCKEFIELFDGALVYSGNFRVAGA